MHEGQASPKAVLPERFRGEVPGEPARPCPASLPLARVCLCARWKLPRTPAFLVTWRALWVSPRSGAVTNACPNDAAAQTPPRSGSRPGLGFPSS